MELFKSSPVMSAGAAVGGGGAGGEASGAAAAGGKGGRAPWPRLSGRVSHGAAAASEGRRAGVARRTCASLPARRRVAGCSSPALPGRDARPAGPSRVSSGRRPRPSALRGGWAGCGSSAVRPSLKYRREKGRCRL